MTDASEDHKGTVSIGSRTITNLHFADDINGLAGEEEELANLVERLDKAYSMEISAQKTKLITNTTSGINTAQRLPDDRKEMQTAVVWSCFPFIRSGQNQTEEEVGGKTTSGNGQA